MKFKYDFDQDSLFQELKNDDQLFWNGNSIPLNKCIILTINSSFEDKVKRTKEDWADILKGKKRDYSAYESKIYIKLFANGESYPLFSYWKSEFENLESSEFLQTVFVKADEILTNNLNQLESLKAQNEIIL